MVRRDCSERSHPVVWIGIVRQDNLLDFLAELIAISPESFADILPNQLPARSGVPASLQEQHDGPGSAEVPGHLVESRTVNRDILWRDLRLFPSPTGTRQFFTHWTVFPVTLCQTRRILRAGDSQSSNGRRSQ